MHAHIYLCKGYDNGPCYSDGPYPPGYFTEGYCAENGERKMIGSMRRWEAVPTAAWDYIVNNAGQVGIVAGPQPVKKRLHQCGADLV